MPFSFFSYMKMTCLMAVNLELLLHADDTCLLFTSKDTKETDDK